MGGGGVTDCSEREMGGGGGAERQTDRQGHRDRELELENFILQGVVRQRQRDTQRERV